MKMYNKFILLLFAILLSSQAFYAQSERFGSVTKEDLKETYYAPDSAASAVVLLKKRNTYYDYDNIEGWRLVTVVHERIKLFNQNGFDYASKKIPLYIGKTDEVFTIKGYTYNLENNKIEKTKLSRNDVFKEEASDFWGSRNFTMPNLKKGSIVEWKYTVTSPYTRSIDDLICQYDIPIKKLSAKIQIPDYYEFNAFPNPYNPINLIREKVQKNYIITQVERSEINSGFDNTKTSYSKKDVKLNENVFKVEQQDIPALKEEPYVNNIDNYRARVSFEIAAYRPPNGVAEYYNTSWRDVTKTILDSPNFGGQLGRSKFFEDDLNLILEKYTANNERILAIFEFIKRKVIWDESYGKYTHDGGIKKAYKEGSGNVAEVNLCLIAMLREAGIHANPVLVSTRSNGVPVFPTKKGFNYVIAAVETNGKAILLDATEKFSGPNILPLRDLNWKGRLVREDGTSTSINLYPKNYAVKTVNVSAKLNLEGAIEGVMITKYNGLNALDYRVRFADQKEEALITYVESNNQDIEIDQFKLRNKEVIGKPLTEMVKFTKDNAVDIIGDKIYVSPMLFLTEYENPFKQEERSYPIDYGSPWKNEKKISLEIPEGYIVSSTPEDLSLALPEGMGSYILKTELKENKIFITAQTKLNVPLIAPHYYSTIKELYKRAIENQQEKIVMEMQGP